jgi:hypothetical protein
MKPEDKKNKKSSLQTEQPHSERDEIEAAEARTQELYDKSKNGERQDPNHDTSEAIKADIRNRKK